MNSLGNILSENQSQEEVFFKNDGSLRVTKRNGSTHPSKANEGNKIQSNSNIAYFKSHEFPVSKYYRPNLALSNKYQIARKHVSIIPSFSKVSFNRNFLSTLAKILTIAFTLPTAVGGLDSSQSKGFYASLIGGNSGKRLNSSNLNASNDQALNYKETISLNMQLKSQSVLGTLFITAVVIVFVRLTKKCEVFKQKLPKVLSLFWLFISIQLYLDLNLLQLDQKPYSKALFQNLSLFDQSMIYLPEVLHFILFLMCLFYFFSLVFRFNELFGHEEVDQLVEQLQQQLLKEQKVNLDPKQQQLLIEHTRQQTLGGFVSQSIITVDNLTYVNSLQLYHLTILMFILFTTFIKLALLQYGLLFIKITKMPISTLDNMELFMNSPRILSLFTVSYLAYSQYMGRTNVDKQQYTFQKLVPFFVALIHSVILVAKKRLILTFDDVLSLIIFIISFALYQTYESTTAMIKGRFPHQLFFTERKPIKPIGYTKDGIPIFKDTPDPPYIKISKEEIKRRQKIIDEAIKKREEDHEEYMRQKNLITQRKNESLRHLNDSQNEISGDDYSDHPPQNNEDSFEDRSEASVKSNEAIEVPQQKEEKPQVVMTKEQAKAAHQKIQELILEQLNQQLSEEAKRILQLSGGIDLSNEQELLMKLGLINSLKVSQQNASEVQDQQKSQGHTTQGGQGQQSSVSDKQTAHKAPTKAPTGRPNPRKRR